MKTNRLLNVLIALLLLVPLSVMTSCSEEDAPELTHSLDELSGTWTWETTDGREELGDAFLVTMKKHSSNQIAIVGFHGQEDEEVYVTVSGTSLSFEGEIVDGNIIITGGTGTIINGWESMTISYHWESNGVEGDISASIERGEKTSSKRAKISAK
ncbi:MAG: hypothetical protein II852_17300 [Bacteroidales bacterium]|nr:hypothetical protein [Bacteroidales bacterium]